MNLKPKISREARENKEVFEGHYDSENYLQCLVLFTLHTHLLEIIISPALQSQ